MIELWFANIVLLFTAYVILDGFDLGAGALHLWVARSDEERRMVLGAIGPYWDGNEVCLLAAGGALFVAFPKALSAGISGFYFAIFLVLWCLVLRGIAIEFRSHLVDRLWRSAWDAAFSAASVLLAVFLGAALGNLLRGLPLDRDGWFSLALFTDFTPAEPVGILDWYTTLVGLFALLALAGHGATFLAWKTIDQVRKRSERIGRRTYAAVALLWPVVTVLTDAVNPDLFVAWSTRPLAWLLTAGAVAGLAAVFIGPRQGRPLAAFLGSSLFLGGILATTAVCFFPVILRSCAAGASITAYHPSTDVGGLATALGWWGVGLPLAVMYFVFNFRWHRGRVAAPADGHGY
jgi:cytochrome d ubiquinol oxidase subunit II